MNLFNKKKCLFYVKIIISVLIIQTPAHSYFDPGPGAFIIQSIIAFFAAVVVYLSHPIATIKRIFSNIKKKIKRNKEEEKKEVNKEEI